MNFVTCRSTYHSSCYRIESRTSLCGCNLQCVWGDKFVLLVILTWSCAGSCSEILQKRLKRGHVLPSARETGKESALGQRVKNHGNGWLTSTKTQVWTRRKKPLRARVSGNRCNIHVCTWHVQWLLLFNFRRDWVACLLVIHWDLYILK